jgi:excisionase family DNA binding protein
MEKMLRASEVARLLGFTDIYVYRLAREGKLKKVRVGKRAVRFPESEISRWLAAEQAR